MSDEKCSTGGILVAFLAGGLIGAGLALLYAPAPGRETRERIGGMADEIKKKSDQLSGDLKQKVEGFVEEERSVLKAAYDAGRDAMAREKARFQEDVKPAE